MEVRAECPSVAEVYRTVVKVALGEWAAWDPVAGMASAGRPASVAPEERSLLAEKVAHQGLVAAGRPQERAERRAAPRAPVDPAPVERRWGVR